MPHPNQLKFTVPSSDCLPTIATFALTRLQYEQLSGWLGEDHELILQGEQSEESFICQLCSIGMDALPEQISEDFRLYALIDRPALGTLSLNKRPTPGPIVAKHGFNPYEHAKNVYIDHQKQNARVTVCIDSRLFTRYLYSRDNMRPYFYPLAGPHGKTLTQDSPDDHLHHHALWWGHDNVNGHQVYHEFLGEGRQAHREFLALFGGPVFGQISALIDWLAADGTLLLRETRTMRIYNLPGQSRYVDLVTTLHATNGDIVFGDTKEGGFPFIRVNEQINAHHGGKISASTGLVGERDIFATKADWVDYSGTIFLNVQAGISMFSHPESDDYQPQWFVRDYGPFTSSNFHFSGGYTLTSGNTYTFKQRLYLHEGDADAGRVAQRYQEYSQPLQLQAI